MKYVASSISQMTDYDKYYVYTGHEEGMITGCWYFWSGTEWLIGGDYQCGIDDIIETSSTMDEEGMPADAKAVGDMIVVSDTEPTSPHTELWIDPDTESVLVPTMDDIEGTYAKKSEVESTYARKAAVGSPLRAATASAMTDVTKIYVYTGSESGYTAGHWYYYNGSSWADGGVYNSTAFVTDKTLTGDGEAADAKVTGDEITDLKSAFNNTIDATDVFEMEAVTPTIYNDKSIYQSGGNWVCGGSTGFKTAAFELTTNELYRIVVANGDSPMRYGFTNTMAGNTDISNVGEYNAPLLIKGDGTYKYFYITYMRSSAPSATVSISHYKTKIEEFDVAINNINGSVNGLASTQKIPCFSDTVTGTTFKTVNLNLSSGAYFVSASSVISDDTTDSECKINFYNNATVIGTINFKRGVPVETFITLTSDCDAINFYAAKDYSASIGDAFSFNDLTIQKETNLGVKITKLEKASASNNVGIDIFRLDKYFSHIGVDKSDDIIIPCQSIADISRTRRLGFSVLELNVRKTSDNKYVCLHGASGKFGYQFTDTNGNSVADIAVNSMTLQEIKDNIRFKSNYAKFKTAPFTLEEMLIECKKQGVIPLVEYQPSYTDEVELLDSIMGKNNYILNVYNLDRDNITDAPCASWLTITSPSSLVNKCEASGGMYIASLNVTDAAYNSFTDADWKSLVEAVHKAGYLIGFVGGYAGEAKSQKLLSLGFDVSGSSWNIPEINNGNLCNLFGDVDFSDFVTNGTVANGVLTLSIGNIITPNASSIPSVFLGGGSLHIRFNGTITLVFGDSISDTFTSDGTAEMWFSTYFEESAPTFTITATANTEVYGITYKASRM